MKKSQILALLANSGDDDEVDSILNPAPEPPAPAPVPPVPPTPPTPPVPPAPLKTDDKVTMTAAEFMKLMSGIKQQEQQTKSKEEENDAEVFLY